MKRNFSVIREVLQDASDSETPEENERAMLTGRATPTQALVALSAIESRVAELKAMLSDIAEGMENESDDPTYEELRRGYRELRRVIRTIQPRLEEAECDCGDEGLCDKHLVEVTLANHPKL